MASPARCRCCGLARGFLYTGPVYAEAGLDDALCPWCIADGSAHAKFGVTFVDEEAFDDDVPESVIEEITQRTPGFSTWQPERWLSCEGEAAAFLEPAGSAEIRGRYPHLEGQLMSYIVHELGLSGGAARRFLESLDRERGPTAYVFHSAKFDRHLAFIDFV